ncbi:MAG: hypothetical protein NT092_00050 [Bacteroidia bacterium]|nr:hypothetical protein [Bacteroidia bacterium]
MFKCDHLKIHDLGKRPSFIAGAGNKVTSFFMQRVMPRKMAINIMSGTARKIYDL